MQKRKKKDNEKSLEYLVSEIRAQMEAQAEELHDIKIQMGELVMDRQLETMLRLEYT